MIYYKLYYKNPQSHYIYVDMIIDGISSDTLHLQLPAWRPGRYELGNFAKNIKRVDIYNEQEEPLKYTKASKDLWIVETANTPKIKVTYSYYASEINAGSSYIDDKQFYVNPVNLCLYVSNRNEEKHVIDITVPDNYKIVTSLKSLTERKYEACSFDELADSPFMASASIHSDSYIVNGTTFYLHFNGECRPDFKQLKKDFIAFTEKQLEFWRDFPFDTYHFLFQILPYKFYHGVEHLKSTVIAIGPGYHINKGKTYEDILGVSSHELFHAWNIKTIRPKEMMPYDYTKENYARTGYVYEGFTTYYGDLILRSSNIFSDEQYFETLEERINKHFHNYGRFNLSVAQSSWETWLDGYVPGAPYRKTSIYDEGCLVAFMLDSLILKATNNTSSLKTVCQKLYSSYGKQTKGYSEQDVITIIEEITKQSFHEFFNKYVYGTENYETLLNECFNYVGLELQKTPSAHLSENSFGFKTIDAGYTKKVSLIAPYSPGWDAGLSVNDDILAVNGYTLKNDLNDWLNYFSNEPTVSLTISSSGNLKTIILTKSKYTYFHNYRLQFITSATEQQKTNYKTWISC